MSDDKQMQYIRAKEVITGAEWVFDLYRASQLEVMLSEAPLDEREKAYQRARVASEMQSGLMNVVEKFEVEAKQTEQKAAWDALTPEDRLEKARERREERQARKTAVKQKQQEERRRGR